MHYTVFTCVGDSDLDDEVSKDDDDHFCIQCSVVLFSGLPETDKKSVRHILTKRSNRSQNITRNETLLIKKKHVPTNQTSEWEEVTVQSLYSFINYTTNLKSVAMQNIWNILILLDIDIPPLTLYYPYILPQALLTFVIGDVYQLQKSFKVYEQLKDDSSVQSFDNLCLFKSVISANCLKENSKQYAKDYGMINKLIVSKGRGYLYTVFVGIHQGVAPESLTMINNGLSRMINEINCPKEKEPLSVLPIGKCKLLYCIDTSKSSDENAQKLFQQMDRRSWEQTVYKIPFMWLMLILELKLMHVKIGQHYVSFNELYETIWKKKFNNVKVAELSAALKLFDNLGVILYFGGNGGYIFYNWSWLLEMINSFMKKSIPAELTTFNAYNIFVYEGILNERMISDISQEFDVDINLLLQLLVHLKLSVPLHRSTVESIEYFIPNRLPAIKDFNNFLSIKYGNIQLEPLMLTYLPGASHPSLFCLFARYLLENKPDYWSHPNDSDEETQYTFSNLMTFPVVNGYSVTLCDKIFYLEIQIRKDESSSSHNDTVIGITSALRVAYNHLKGKITELNWGFLCALCTHDFKRHMMLQQSKRSTKRVCCCKKGQTVDVKDDPIPKTSLM